MMVAAAVVDRQRLVWTICHPDSLDRRFRIQPHVEIIVDALHQQVELAGEEMVRARDRVVMDRDVALGAELVDQLLDRARGDDFVGLALDDDPRRGQGARKLKSYMLAGGAIEMKPLISGRRISSCIPIQAPKLTPATQVVSASGWICWTQSSAEAASDSSPMPLSNVPWLLPTPRKLKRRVAKPRRTKVW